MLTLRKAEPCDIDDVRSIQAAAFQALLEKYADVENPASETHEQLLRRLTQRGQEIDLIVLDGASIGYLILQERGEECVLIRIGVLPEYQGRGYGQQAILLAEALHPDATTWVRDTILQETKLCQLYEKLGYRDTGKREHIQEGMDLILYVKQRG